MINPDEKFLPERVSEDLVHEVDDFLANGIPESKDELTRLLAKLDTAIAITADPKATELRHALIARFGNDVEQVERETRGQREKLERLNNAIREAHSIERIVNEARAERIIIDARTAYAENEIKLARVLRSPVPATPEERVGAREAEREVNMIMGILERYLETHDAPTTKDKEDILSSLDRVIALNNDRRAEKLRIELMKAWKIYGN